MYETTNATSNITASWIKVASIFPLLIFPPLEIINVKGYKKVFKPFLNKSNMAKVRIKLNSTDIGMLNEICNSIKELSKNSGIVISGPVPLPTKKLKITTRKSPCRNGTATFDRYEMRIHKRLIDMPAQDRVLRPLMMLKIPRSVQIKIDIKD